MKIKIAIGIVLLASISAQSQETTACKAALKRDAQISAVIKLETAVTVDAFQPQAEVLRSLEALQVLAHFAAENIATCQISDSKKAAVQFAHATAEFQKQRK
jgi:hypothetical protein